MWHACRHEQKGKAAHTYLIIDRSKSMSNPSIFPTLSDLYKNKSFRNMCATTCRKTSPARATCMGRMAP